MNVVAILFILNLCLSDVHVVLVQQFPTGGMQQTAEGWIEKIGAGGYYIVFHNTCKSSRDRKCRVPQI